MNRVSRVSQELPGTGTLWGVKEVKTFWICRDLQLELCLVFSLAVTGLNDLGQGNACLCYPAKEEIAIQVCKVMEGRQIVSDVLRISLRRWASIEGGVSLIIGCMMPTLKR